VTGDAVVAVAAVVPDDDVVPDAAVVPDELLLAVLGDEVATTAVVVDLVVLELASAGSWPVTSCTVMTPNAATNTATAPPTMRRRIMLIRRARAARLASASRRRSSALTMEGVMFIGLVSWLGQYDQRA